MNNELYKYLKEILLSSDDEHHYLIDYCSDKLNNFNKNKDISDDEKKEIKLYFDGLNNFFIEWVKEIYNYKKEIAYNYFIFLHKFFNYLKIKNRSIEYFKDYRISVIRTMEIALILQKFNIQARDIFFNNKNIDFYSRLLEIYQINFQDEGEVEESKIETYDTKILNGTFHIKKEGVGIEIGDKNILLFRSTVKNPRGYAKPNPTLSDYLKLKYLGVYQVYHSISLSRDNNGGGEGISIELIPLDSFSKEVYHEYKILRLKQTSKTYDYGEKYEVVAKSNKRIKSPTTISKTYGIDDIVKEYNNYVDTKYKEHIIHKPKNINKYKEIRLNKSIGHLSAKANLHLPSQYNIPDINMLCNFLLNIKDKQSYEYKILISAILLGIDIRQLIGIELKLSKDFTLIHKKYLRVNLTTVYAQNRDKTLFKSTKKYVEFELPKFLLSYFDIIEDMLYKELMVLIKKEKTFDIDNVKKKFHTSKNINKFLDFLYNQYGSSQINDLLNKFLDNEIKKFKKYILSERKKYKKFIKITVNTLHLYSFHYYKLLHKESDIAHLFLKRKTSNLHTKLTYVASPTRMIKMTKWVEELADILHIKQANRDIYDINTLYSGSNKLVLSGKYKNFLIQLDSIVFENNYSNLTIKMIYLRYVFCILLATRRYRFSSDLQEYSKKKKLLFIHEKAKNTYSSKRIVPVTNLGSKYIEKFYQLKDKYNIHSYSPVIINDEGKEKSFNQENLIKWLNAHKEYIIKKYSYEFYKSLDYFIINVVRDFGRHIFASKAHDLKFIKQDYVDAFLNHFYRGTQDQGMYSLFDNQEYFKQIRKLMEHIEKEYIPFWKEVGI